MADTDISGVYAIRNTISGRIYIGSSYLISARWHQHKHLLRKGTHHSRVLQRSWNKHGEAAFTFSVIETVTSLEALFEREQHWIDTLHAACPVRGLNRYPTAGGPRGFKVSAETRALMSVTRRGRKMPPRSAEHSAAISTAKLGHKHSVETLLRWSVERRGRKIAARSSEHKAAISAAMTGRKQLKSPEHLAKLRANLIAMNKSAQARARTARMNRARGVEDNPRQLSLNI